MLYQISLRRNPCLFKHINAVILRRRLNTDDLLFTVVEAVPYLAPIAAGAGFAVLGRAGFEEVGVLDTVQQWREPGEWVVFDHVDGGQAKLAWKPGTMVTVGAEDAAQLMKLIDVLDDDDDVQTVWGNYDVPDDVMAAL